MAKQTLDLGKRWYVLHTYSGYEENVKRNLEQRIDTFDMHDKICAVMVPKEKKIKIKAGKRVTVEEKVFPGYVLVEMVVTDDSWYVVRNTPNVTGFVGAGTTPVPIDPKEMLSLQKRVSDDEPLHKIDLDVNDSIQIIDGPFKGFEGKVSDVDDARGKIKVLVSMFGRETPVELDALQVKKV
ncbi:MAG: transcription termination/antitermination protein NusG [Candidatus Magasanikbacteria bacterium]|jgi:transcription termination/antitermination protein NusG|nr:transcription termination/antitermination protein NusG [Candidatus Magasanikbacteria bacterium]